MKQSDLKKNEKNGGMHIRWKLFISFFFVSMMILLILWSCQVLFISSFYQYVKTGELKSATNEVIANLDSDDSEAIFNRIILQGDINVRIINTSDFQNVYSGGDGVTSATHDIGDFEVLRLYDLAKANGGEVSQYYTYDRENEDFLRDIHVTFHKSESVNSTQSGENSSEKTDGNTDTETGAARKEIGVQFFTGRPGFFRNERYVDDFLYAKLATLDDGTELMVISDVQVTPLDSTISILSFRATFPVRS